jgi:phospholipid transport system transporter-binding protein
MMGSPIFIMLKPLTMKTPQFLFEISQEDSGRFKLEGELSFVSVQAAIKKTADFFAPPANKMVFDLAGITKADSAGLALLLEWLRLSSLGGVELHYVNLPRQLLAMAHVAGVDDILIID